MKKKKKTKRQVSGKRGGNPHAKSLRIMADRIYNMADEIEHTTGGMTARQEQAFFKKAAAGVKENTQVVEDAEKEQ